PLLPMHQWRSRPLQARPSDGVSRIAAQHRDSPKEFAERRRFPARSFVVQMGRQTGRLTTRRQTMRVMVFAKASEESEKGVAPTPEALEAFAAMDRFIEELVKAGVFVAGAGLKNSA